MYVCCVNPKALPGLQRENDPVQTLIEVDMDVLFTAFPAPLLHLVLRGGQGLSPAYGPLKSRDGQRWTLDVSGFALRMPTTDGEPVRSGVPVLAQPDLWAFPFDDASPWPARLAAVLAWMLGFDPCTAHLMLWENHASDLRAGVYEPTVRLDLLVKKPYRGGGFNVAHVALCWRKATLEEDGWESFGSDVPGPDLPTFPQRLQGHGQHTVAALLAAYDVPELNARVRSFDRAKSVVRVVLDWRDFGTANHGPYLRVWGSDETPGERWEQRVARDAVQDHTVYERGMASDFYPQPDYSPGYWTVPCFISVVYTDAHALARRLGAVLEVAGEPPAASSENRGKVGPWVVIDGYCAAAVLIGDDPLDADKRVAFIEKTPRIRVPTLGDYVDFTGQCWRAAVSLNGQFWLYGPRGRGGDSATEAGVNGFYPPSREWCQRMLQQLGYDVSALLGEQREPLPAMQEATLTLTVRDQ